MGLRAGRGAGGGMVMGLTEEQRKILTRADKTGLIYQGDSDVCPQIHFCHDWDSLPICADSPEAEACTCGRITKGDTP